MTQMRDTTRLMRERIEQLEAVLEEISKPFHFRTAGHRAYEVQGMAKKVLRSKLHLHE